MVPEGRSAVGYEITKIPEPPDVSGLESGECRGNRDNHSRWDGLWVCVYSGRPSITTYAAGTKHGPSGGYDADGQPSGWWGSYADGRSDGVWFWFDSSGVITFTTYAAGTKHGPSGGYDADGQPSGWWGSYADGRSDGVWFWFDSSGVITFTTYAAGTKHGPSGGYNGEGERHGWFGSYSNGNPTGTWAWYENGEIQSTRGVLNESEPILDRMARTRGSPRRTNFRREDWCRAGGSCRRVGGVLSLAKPALCIHALRRQAEYCTANATADQSLARLAGASLLLCTGSFQSTARPNCADSS